MLMPKLKFFLNAVGSAISFFNRYLTCFGYLEANNCAQSFLLFKLTFVLGLHYNDDDGGELFPL